MGSYDFSNGESELGFVENPDDAVPKKLNHENKPDDGRNHSLAILETKVRGKNAIMIEKLINILDQYANYQNRKGVVFLEVLWSWASFTPLFLTVFFSQLFLFPVL